MISVRRMAAAAALFVLPGCAGVDGMADQVEATSTCHTSSGEWVRTSQPCTVSYSASRTVSETTTTTTTTTVNAAPSAADDED